MCASQKKKRRIIKASSRTMKATKASMSDTLKPLQTCPGQTGSKSKPQTSRSHFPRLHPQTTGEGWEFHPSILSATSGGAKPGGATADQTSAATATCGGGVGGGLGSPAGSKASQVPLHVQTDGSR